MPPQVDPEEVNTPEVPAPAGPISYQDMDADALKTKLAIIQYDIERLQREQADAPTVDPTTTSALARAAARRSGAPPVKTKAAYAREIAAQKSIESEINKVLTTKTKAQAAADKPKMTETSAFAVTRSKAPVAQKREALISAGRQDLADEWYPEVDGSVTDAVGSMPSGRVASAGATLRASLQHDIQSRRLTLDEAKAVKDIYFDALTEARQRENLAQDAMSTAERSAAQAMTTERTKMANVVTPADLSLWKNAVNSLGETSGSPFRVPDEWVDSHAPVGINPDILGPQGLDVPAQTAQRAVQSWGMTNNDLDTRALSVGNNALAMAPSFVGGFTPTDQVLSQIPYTPEEMQAILSGLGGGE